MASAVCSRETAIEAVSAPQGIAANAKTAPVRGWHMIVGPFLDLSPHDPWLVSDDEYLAATRSQLNLAPAADTQVAADAEFSAILRMKREPLELDGAQAEMYTGLRQRRSRRVGQPLPIE
jgi:hypothetical protein